MVKIKARCRIPIWRTFGRIRWHVIPKAPAAATLQGVIIPSAILKIRHILFFFVFNAVSALTSGCFCIVSDTLVLICCAVLGRVVFAGVLHTPTVLLRSLLGADRSRRPGKTFHMTFCVRLNTPSMWISGVELA